MAALAVSAVLIYAISLSRFPNGNPNSGVHDPSGSVNADVAVNHALAIVRYATMRDRAPLIIILSTKGYVEDDIAVVLDRTGRVETTRHALGRYTTKSTVIDAADLSAVTVAAEYATRAAGAVVNQTPATSTHSGGINVVVVGTQSAALWQWTDSRSIHPSIQDFERSVCAALDIRGTLRNIGDWFDAK